MTAERGLRAWLWFSAFVETSRGNETRAISGPQSNQCSPHEAQRNPGTILRIAHPRMRVTNAARFERPYLQGGVSKDASSLR